MNTELHSIRFATQMDITAIQAFIGSYWRADHIYCKDKNFFSYEFVYGDNVNFVIAVSNENIIQGILGFIQYQENRENSDLFTVIWKVLPKTGDPQLGIRLLMYLIKESGARSVSTIGADERTLAIYQFLGYKTGTLKHYYIVNPFLSDYTIIHNKKRNKEPFPNIPGGVPPLREITDPDMLISIFSSINTHETGPFKSLWFFKKRYVKHPYFNYRFFTIQHENGIEMALFVIKELNINNSKALRIMDMIGSQDALNETYACFLKLLADEKAEYIDFYLQGIPGNLLLNAGFILRRKNSKVIVPDHFEPFEEKNIELHYFTTNKRNFRIFKGDGDQDRPSAARIM